MSCYQRVIVIKQSGDREMLDKFQVTILVDSDFPIQLNGLSISVLQVRDQIKHSHTLMVASDRFTGQSETPTNFIQYLEESEESNDDWLSQIEELQMIWKTTSGQKYMIVTGVIMGVVCIVGVSCFFYACWPRFQRWRGKEREVQPTKYKAPQPTAPPLELRQVESERLMPSEISSERKVKFEGESGTSSADKGTNVRRSSRNRQ